jgi:NTE family protein
MDKTITAVTGTSIGAVSAAIIAAGDGKNMLRMWNRITLKSITGKIVPFRRISTDSVKEILDSLIDEDKIRHSDILFGFEVMHPRTRRNKELFIEDIPRGQLTEYLTAAVCMPIFRPKKIENEKYIDGAVIDNAPVDMLIDKGYENIILSDDHGIGRERPIKSKANIIRIRCKNPPGGILDFDRETIKRTITQGYFDCLRELGGISGDIYAFDNKDYSEAVSIYGRTTLHELEEKAARLGIDPFRRYSVSTLYERVKL